MTRQTVQAIKRERKLTQKITAEYRRKIRKTIPEMRELSENAESKAIRRLAKRWLEVCETILEK